MVGGEHEGGGGHQGWQLGGRAACGATQSKVCHVMSGLIYSNCLQQEGKSGTSHSILLGSLLCISVPQ